MNATIYPCQPCPLSEFSEWTWRALLDSSLITQTNKFLYDTKIIVCGNYIQVYKYQNKHLKTNKNLVPITETNHLINNKNRTNLKKENQEIRADNIMRSKLSLQRLVKTNIDYFATFITLTFAENIISIKNANKTFNIWRTKAKKSFPNLKYICVPEFQKRGAVHYHLITNITIDCELIVKQKDKTNQYDVKYWNYGFSSVFSLKNINIVNYISKYLTKDINNRLFSQRRYLYSRNLITPKLFFINSKNQKHSIYFFKIIESKSLVFSNFYLNKYRNEKIFFEEYF